MREHNQGGAIWHKLLICFAVFSILVLLLYGGRVAMRYKHERARAAWMMESLPRLAGWSSANENISRELAELKSGRARPDGGWTRENVLLMTNNEYLVYAFYHGYNDGFVDHLFLAHGSDGRWLQHVPLLQ